MPHFGAAGSTFSVLTHGCSRMPTGRGGSPGTTPDTARSSGHPATDPGDEHRGDLHSARPKQIGIRDERRHKQKRRTLSEPASSMIGLRGQDLNLRPSGYEPDELPDCSTPRL
jgi:hypothetical protein